MSELRQRSSATTVTTMSSNDETDEFMLRSGAGLSAKSMMDASPQQHGVVLKLHAPILFSILPDFLKKLILSFSFLSFLAPAWKQRYLILCGSYLYKFNNQSSPVPKGSPFQLKSLDVDITTRQEFPELAQLPPGYSSVFCISTLRRKHYYAVADNDEALTWVRSLQEARQEAITRNMGHANHVPYPKSWDYFDSLAKNLIKSKERIKEKMEGSRMKELEMTNFTEGSPMGRGYHS
jgi:hypothetical protein